MTLVNTFEDGLPYEIRPVTLTVRGVDTEGSFTMHLGGHGHRWAPGRHTTMLYDRNNVRMAEVTWLVTP